MLANAPEKAAIPIPPRTILETAGTWRRVERGEVSAETVIEASRVVWITVLAGIIANAVSPVKTGPGERPRERAVRRTAPR
jgi:hypothetical protein